MYPLIRLYKTLYTARSRSPLKVDEASILPMRVWPGDIDMFMEMNNGRQLTMMDLGRMDYAARTGLLREIRQRRWGLVVAGISIRYRKRLHLLNHYTLHTKLLGYDEKWFYFHQRMRNGEITYSSALIRTGVTSHSGIVPSKEVLGAMGSGDWRPELPEWVCAWAKADDLRPWP